MINKGLTQLKKSKRYEDVKVEVITTNETENIEEITFDYNNTSVKLVLDSLNSLKENYRIILNLIEGFDYEEIAQILNYTS